MLNAMNQKPRIPKQEQERRFTDCWKKTVCRPLDAFPDAFDLPGGSVALMETEPLPQPLDPARILYLDTETTGLAGGAGTVAFEVGLGRLTPSGFVITQLVMRDYPEERFLLAETAAALADCDAVCTFNGRTFDLPLLRDRFLMNRLNPRCLEKPHIDLLHIARRVFKLRLKRCNLGTLEEAVLGIPREGDLPGSEVPERYFSFLKTGEFALLDDVLRHNEQDIASLCVLLNHMARMYRAPERVGHDEDLLSMGNGLSRHRHEEEARRCWQLVKGARFRADGQMKLAASYRRGGDRETAAKVWRGMAERREGGVTPWVELAKYYEHTARDYAAALDCVRRAMALAAEPSLFPPESVQAEQNALQYRYARLRKKLDASAR